jgi:hypothetical protein
MILSSSDLSWQMGELEDARIAWVETWDLQRRRHKIQRCADICHYHILRDTSFLPNNSTYPDPSECSYDSRWYIIELHPTVYY